MTAIDLIVEVAGCPTVCRHCWAQGAPYGAMPLDRVRWVLETVHAWCDTQRIRFGAFPMHEVAAHPRAADLIRLFAEHDWMPAPFQPLTTTGVPLATRDDWRGVLEAAAATGTTVVWMALHGFGEGHDRQVGRRGAFAETCRAVELSHSAGLTVGCNVFLSKGNLHDAHGMARMLSELRVEEQCWEISAYYPHARSRRNERLRPALDDVLPVSERILGWSRFHADQWRNPAGWTEAAWVRRALTGDWPPLPAQDEHEALLVLRPNLDVFFGRAGDYGEHFGNLVHEGVDRTMERAVAAAGRSVDTVWFAPDELLPPPEAAARHGDPEGCGIHMDAESVRYRWLDRARRPAP